MADHPLFGEDEARALAGAALLIERAREGSDDPRAVARALDHNLSVWRSISDAVARANGMLASAVRANLDKLGAAVAAATAESGGAPSQATVTALIDINRRVSAGLLEGQAAAQA